jgi:hypothetical protein
MNDPMRAVIYLYIVCASVALSVALPCEAEVRASITPMTSQDGELTNSAPPSASVADEEKRADWPTILGAANVAAIVVSVALIWLQIRKTQEWNRRKATHDFVTRVIFGSVAKIRSVLEQKINPYDEEQDYATMQQNLTEEEVRLLRDLLNYLEIMCLGIKHGILDNTIAYDCACVVLRIYCRWAQPYIDSAQDDIRFPFNWIEMEHRNRRWTKRLEQDRERHFDSVRSPSLKKL